MNLETNKIYNCDCIELMEQMHSQGVVANCLLTDIPYDGVNRESNGLRNLDKGNADIIRFDLEKFLELSDKVVSGSFLVFCGFSQISTIADFYKDKGYTVRILVWEKTNPSPMNGEHVYLSGTEFCVYARKKGATFNAKCKNTVFRYPCGINEWHPTQKPLALWYELLQDNTNEGDLVLDTCMGGGTTAVACHRTGRNFIGSELSKEFYDNATRRINREMAQISLFDLSLE